MSIVIKDNVFFNYNHTLYKGLKAFFVLTDYNSPRELPGSAFVVDNLLYNELSDKGQLEQYLDSNYVLKYGSEIHMTPKCPLALEDIRKNYTIKRDYDSGDCNVYSPIAGCNSRGRRMWTEGLVFFEKDGVIVFFDRIDSYRKTEQVITAEMVFAVDSLIADGKLTLAHRECYIVKRQFNQMYFISEEYKDFLPLLNKTNKKPCISYEKLEIKAENELNTDVLKILLTTATSDGGSADDVATQLMMLNQHNWRDYPGTIHLVLDRMIGYRGKMSCIRGRLSHYPKPVKNIIEFSWSKGINTFADEKDWNLTKQFLEELLNVGQQKFVKYEDIDKKIDEYRIPEDTFHMFYNTIVRITPKKYEEASESSVS